LAAITGFGTIVSAVGQKKASTAQQNIAFLNSSTIEQTAEANAQLTREGTAVNVGALEWNASMAEMQARDAIQRGRESEGIFRQQTRGVIGQERAAFGASGVDVSSGSALDVQTNTAYVGELDALMIRTNAMRTAWGFKVEAQDYRQQAVATQKLGSLEEKNALLVGRANARSARLGGTYAGQAGNYAAASTILGGAGNIALTALKYKAKGT
jgi:hypothetical protein